MAGQQNVTYQPIGARVKRLVYRGQHAEGCGGRTLVAAADAQIAKKQKKLKKLKNFHCKKKLFFFLSHVN